MAAIDAAGLVPYEAVMKRKSTMLRKATGVLLAGTIAVAWSGCGDSEPGAGPSGENSGGAGGDGSSASAGTGATISLAGNGGATGSGSAGEGGGQDCTDCASGQLCVEGACVCPQYQSLCDGACIPSSVDPDNCGGCDQACDEELVCSGGGCVDECLPGMTACAGACHDIWTSNDHCGLCDNPCEAGEGCVHGECAATLELGTAPDKCAGGGPPITIDPGSADECSGNVAQTTFTWALCSCSDVDSSSLLFVDGFDSTDGPYVPGELGGGVGVNGSYHSSSDTDVWGTLWATGDATTSAPSEVHNELHVGGLVDVNPFAVGDAAYVGGDVGGDLAVAGALTTPAGSVVDDSVTYGDLVRDDVSVPAPCRCQPDEIIAVAAIVAAHAQDNDNELIGLDAQALNDADRPARVDLPCGEYYFAGIAGNSAPLAIVAHGRTALYIDGDVSNSTFLAFTLEPGAELDVFIAGSLNTSSDIVIGSPNYPALTRVYVGGSEEVRFSADARLAGNFYAANALVVWTSTSEAYGSVFAGEFEASAPTRIHYDRQVTTVGDDGCDDPPGGGGGGGSGPPSCGSCTDCNNQACVDGACGQCSSSADCCAPLECSDGVCVTVVK
jgi:hypothetical protein